MATPKDEYRKLMLIEDLREELLKAYVKNAALRDRKLRLESELGKISDRLKKNDAVQEVLARKEFEGLEIAASPEFLRDIEEQAVSAHRKKKKKAPASSDGGARRPKSSDADKRALLLEIVRAHDGEEFMLRDIARYLADKGITTPPSAWLKSLAIPAAAMPDVQKGNRRAGKRFIPSKIKWLCDESGVVSG